MLNLSNLHTYIKYQTQIFFSSSKKLSLKKNMLVMLSSSQEIFIASLFDKIYMPVVPTMHFYQNYGQSDPL